MNDNEPLAVGDHVRLRQFPSTHGTIWDIMSKEDTVIVEWNDPDEDVYVTSPRRWLEKIVPRLHVVTPSKPGR
jgi:hypothetical protein